jgi:hypothetical protein
MAEQAELLDPPRRKLLRGLAIGFTGEHAQPMPPCQEPASDLIALF